MANWRKCSKCGADNDPSAKMCWLCWDDLSGGQASAPKVQPPPLANYVEKRVAQSEVSILGRTIVVVIGYFLVAWGLFVGFRALGLLFALFALPVLIGAGRKNSAAGKGTLVGAAGFLFYIIGSLVIGLLIAVAVLFALCLGMSGVLRF